MLQRLDVRAGRTPSPASSVSPTEASCGWVNTAAGTKRWSEAIRSPGCARLCATTRSSWLATCLSWCSVLMSPRAQTPSALTCAGTGRRRPARRRAPRPRPRRDSAGRSSDAARWRRAACRRTPSCRRTARRGRRRARRTRLSRATPVRRSHRSRTMSVNRSVMSRSRRRSRPLRDTTVTCTPNPLKMAANSAAMYPEPSTIRCSGSSSMRMIVSDVWNGTPESATTGGHGRARAGREHDAVGGQRLAGREPQRPRSPLNSACAS